MEPKRIWGRLPKVVVEEELNQNRLHSEKPYGETSSFGKNAQGTLSGVRRPEATRIIRMRAEGQRASTSE